MDEPRAILVGVGDQAEALDALPLARSLAGIRGARLIVAVVLPYDPLPFAVADYDAAIADHFERLFEVAANILGDTGFERRPLLDSSPARALEETATAEQAELIVAGPGHRGRFGRLYHGEVAKRLLAGAPCAVAVAPRDYRRRSRSALGPIGVAYDGSAESQLALDYAVALAGEAGVSLRTISVMQPVWTPVLLGEAQQLAIDEAVRDGWRRSLERARGRIPDQLEVEEVFEEGFPVDVLRAQAGQLGLLVMGSRGYGPLRRAVFGSVSEDLLHDLACPLVIVPRGSTEGREEPAGRAAARGIAADPTTETQWTAT